MGIINGDGGNQQVTAQQGGGDTQKIARSGSSGSLVRILFDDKQRHEEAKDLVRSYLIDCDDLEVGERIGEGSSGIVYRGAYQGRIQVAVKEVKGVSKGERPPEFRREVLSLISCSAHKNVLKLYGVCASSQRDSNICIVTKFMEGGSLLQLLQRRSKPLKLSETLRIAKDVATGMEFLHSRGIVHMDLKAANVFLDEEGNAVIGDLGVARLANESTVEGGGGEVGSYRWMAPEVCGAMLEEEAAPRPFSVKSDVYSFGVVVWEVVTREVPYADYSPVQAAVGVVMHGLRPAIPDACFPPLRYLIQKCWDQSPSARPHFSHILHMLRIISNQNWN